MAPNVRIWVERLQSFLDWEGVHLEQFDDHRKPGRVAAITCILSFILGLHFASLFFFFPYNSPYWLQWPSYIVFLCTFHLLEFFVTACANPMHDPPVGANTFMVNHSEAYTTAFLAACIEYWGRFALSSLCGWDEQILPWKTCWIVGCIFIMAGQLTRSTAMWQAGRSFCHVVQIQKVLGHKLVTTGIYRHLRHPAYTGWFYWSVGTQILLCNPFCTILYAVVAQRFFAERVPFEEKALVQMYGNIYREYALRSKIFIPGLRGYTDDQRRRN